ncbi:MAG: hypothetical protein ACK5N8_00830 [Alphaproteobacteria bacterium]
MIINKKTFLMILSVLTIAIFTPLSSQAAVHFIEKNNSSASSTNNKSCLMMGYTYTKSSCPDGKVASNPCPTDGKYFKTCGCDTKNKFTSSNCKAPNVLVGGCNNTYFDKCECSGDEYKFNSSNCKAPKVLSTSNSCTEKTYSGNTIVDGTVKYKSCSCPTTYSKTCTGNMIPTNASDGCDNKYTSCKCDPSKFTLTTCSNGAADGTTTCTEENGTKRYQSCKTDLTPTEKCANEGYTVKACPNKYYTTTKCPYDATYLKCEANCGAKIVDKYPTYTIDEANYGSASTKTTTVITKDSTYLPSANTILSNVNFPEIPECKVLPKPTIRNSITFYGGGSYSGSSIRADRIENINFIYSTKNAQAPEYCSSRYSWENNSSCKSKCSSYDSSYDCCSYDCVEDCNSSYSGSSYICTEYKNFIDKYYYDPCRNIDWSSSCSTDFSKTAGLSLEGVTSTQESYTVNGKASTRYFYTTTLKNIDITVTGDAKFAVIIGGGAHYQKTANFEGTNSITGGNNYSVWVRGHNTYAYGIVKGILNVKSGAKLNLSKGACIYNQWNGQYSNSGSVTGTVKQNCDTYKLTW